MLDNISLEQRVLVAGGKIVVREGTRFVLVLGLDFLQLVALGYTEVSKVALRAVRTLLLSCLGEFELQKSLSLLQVDCPLQVSLQDEAIVNIEEDLLLPDFDRLLDDFVEILLHVIGCLVLVLLVSLVVLDHHFPDVRCLDLGLVVVEVHLVSHIASQ